MPKISVVYPMYNVSEYLENSLKSVLDQTYRDFELIAVNDGSTDATPEVFERTASKYAGGIDICLINKENGGLADARNAALDAARGEWIVFIDSDDLMHPEYLRTLIADAERFGADLALSSFKNVTEDTLFDFGKVQEGEPIGKQDLMRLLLPRKKFLTACWCMLVKKQLLDDHSLRFNKDVRFSVDRAFLWKVIDLADGISINYSQLYHYYIREGSIMTSSKKENLLTGVAYFTSVIRSLQNLPFDSEILINRWKLGLLHSSAKLVSYRDYKDLREKMGFSYHDSMKIPTFRSKLFSLTGIVSERLLYTVFLKL